MSRSCDVVRALHIDRLTNCTVIGGVCAGSVLLEGSSDSTFFLATRQVLPERSYTLPVSRFPQLNAWLAHRLCAIAASAHRLDCITQPSACSTFTSLVAPSLRTALASSLLPTTCSTKTSRNSWLYVCIGVLLLVLHERRVP